MPDAIAGVERQRDLNPHPPAPSLSVATQETSVEKRVLYPVELCRYIRGGEAVAFAASKRFFLSRSISRSFVNSGSIAFSFATSPSRE